MSETAQTATNPAMPVHCLVFVNARFQLLRLQIALIFEHHGNKFWSNDWSSDPPLEPHYCGQNLITLITYGESVTFVDAVLL